MTIREVAVRFEDGPEGTLSEWYGPYLWVEYLNGWLDGQPIDPEMQVCSIAHMSDIDKKWVTGDERRWPGMLVTPYKE